MEFQTNGEPVTNGEEQLPLAARQAIFLRVFGGGSAEAIVAALKPEELKGCFNLNTLDPEEAKARDERERDHKSLNGV